MMSESFWICLVDEKGEEEEEVERLEDIEGHVGNGMAMRFTGL